MPRPKRTIRTVVLKAALSEDLAARVQLHLFSEVEGKIPLGAYQLFFTELVSRFFEVQDNEQSDKGQLHVLGAL
jgi:hypothetical protein